MDRKRDAWKLLLRKGRGGILTLRKDGREIGKIVHRKHRGRWRWEIHTRDGVSVLHEELTCNSPPSADN